MYIHGRFPGGNIRVDRIEGDDVYLEQELRDTEGWWFYWGFCVEGAAGRSLTFHFTNGHVVGYRAAAVSPDNVEYHWLGDGHAIDGATFTYDFGAEEERVFFRYALPYQLSNYENWLRKQTAPIETGVLCVTERGRNLPYFILGDADAERSIFFTSRHHACESMATWGLEGAVEACIQQLADLKALNCNLIVAPFIDLDGVEDGDQGKNRAPHDQNRDYIDEPHYVVIRALTRLAQEKQIAAFVDYHDPWYQGEVNDHLSLVRRERGGSLVDHFAAHLKEETARNATERDIVYTGAHDIYPGELWVPAIPNPATSVSFFRRLGVDLAVSIEIPYFGTPDFTYDQGNVKRLGGCIARALLRTLQE